MSVRDEKAAAQHPQYDEVLQQAVKMAAEGSQAMVYWDGTAVSMRSAYAPNPANGELICIVQRWDDKTIQLRFAGARIEWVNG